MGAKSTISVEFAILLWIIILVIVFFILKTYRITWWSSLVFSMLVSWIVLCLAYPFSACPKFNRSDKRSNNHSNKYSSECSDDDCDRHRNHMTFTNNITNEDGLFYLISLVTIVIVIVYLIQRVFRDREDYTSHQQNTMSPYQY